jgi:hypothetical protein
MQILECKGYELEKAQPNTSEDFFNRSEVRFIEDGDEKTFHLLYIRYFDEMFSAFTPFEQDPVFAINGTDVFFRDLVAIVCLLKNPSYRHRKRVYINNQKELAQYFSGINFEKLQEIFKELIENGSYELKSSLSLIEHS